MGTILWNCVLSCEWDYGTQSCFQYVIKWLLANVDKLWLSYHHSTRLAKISIFIYLKIPLLHSTLNVLKVWFINLIWSKSKQVPCINISDFNFSSALYCINVFLEWNFFLAWKAILWISTLNYRVALIFRFLSDMIKFYLEFGGVTNNLKRNFECFIIPIKSHITNVQIFLSHIIRSSFMAIIVQWAALIGYRHVCVRF